jgi:hypothetical protein
VFVSALDEDKRAPEAGVEHNEQNGRVASR